MSVENRVSEDRIVVPSADEPPDGAARPWRVSWPMVVEALALCLAPVVLYKLYRPEPFHLGNTIDPFLYLGYSWDPKDLIDRFGMEYYPVRFGLTLPIDLFTRMFGVEGGFFALRYVLALVGILPLYAYLKASRDRAVAVLGVLLYLTSPMLLRGLMSAYSDTTAIPYLTAAICILGLLQVRPQTRRGPLLFVAGVALGLAVHSNPIIAVLVGVIAAVWGVAEIRSRRWRILTDGLWIVAAVAVVTVAGVLVYWYRFDHPDIFSPSIDAATRLSGDDGDAFKAPDLAWLSYRFFLYLPPLIVVAWLIGPVRSSGAVGSDRPASHRDESTMIAMLAALAGFFVVHQFVLGSSTLETYYYTSYLTPVIVLGLTLVIARMMSGTAGWQRWVPAGLVFALPFLRRGIAPNWEFDWNPGLIIVVVGALAAVIVVRRWSKVALTGCVAMLLANQAMLNNAPSNPPLSDGQTFRFDPHYEQALDNQSSSLGWYEMSHELTEIMPPLTSPSGNLLFWYDTNQSILSSIQATYRSMPIAWQAGLPSMPAIDDAQMLRLSTENVDRLVLLALTDAEIRAATDALLARGVRIAEARPSQLTAPGYVIYADVLRIELPSPPGP